MHQVLVLCLAHHLAAMRDCLHIVLVLVARLIQGILGWGKELDKIRTVKPLAVVVVRLQAQFELLSRVNEIQNKEAVHATAMSSLLPRAL